MCVCQVLVRIVCVVFGVYVYGRWKCVGVCENVRVERVCEWVVSVCVVCVLFV